MELVVPFMNLVSMVMFKCATRNMHKRYWMHASGTLCTYSPLTFPVILSKWDSFSYIAAKQSRDQTSHWLPHHWLHTRKCLEIQIHVTQLQRLCLSPRPPPESYSCVLMSVNSYAFKATSRWNLMDREGRSKGEVAQGLCNRLEVLGNPKWSLPTATIHSSTHL